MRFRLFMSRSIVSHCSDRRAFREPCSKDVCLRFIGEQADFIDRQLFNVLLHPLGSFAIERTFQVVTLKGQHFADADDD